MVIYIYRQKIDYLCFLDHYNGYDNRDYGYNGNPSRRVAEPGYPRPFDINLRTKRSNDDSDSQVT